jgi:hypothetical protein
MQTSRVEGRTLYPLSYSPLDPSLLQGKAVVSYIMDNVRKNLAEKVSSLDPS